MKMLKTSHKEFFKKEANDEYTESFLNKQYLQGVEEINKMILEDEPWSWEMASWAVTGDLEGEVEYAPATSIALAEYFTKKLEEHADESIEDPKRILVQLTSIDEYTASRDLYDYKLTVLDVFLKEIKDFLTKHFQGRLENVVEKLIGQIHEEEAWHEDYVRSLPWYEPIR